MQSLCGLAVSVLIHVQSREHLKGRAIIEKLLLLLFTFQIIKNVV